MFSHEVLEGDVIELSESAILATDGGEDGEINVHVCAESAG